MGKGVVCEIGRKAKTLTQNLPEPQGKDGNASLIEADGGEGAVVVRPTVTSPPAYSHHRLPSAQMAPSMNSTEVASQIPDVYSGFFHTG